MTESKTIERPLRADAERNRLRIIAAARDAFAERGFDASLDEVAARAGVGVGTVYRRFPDKDALIEALFEERISDVAEIGRRALRADDPWEGFVSFMTEAMALQARDRGLKQALLSRGRDRSQRARDTIAPIVAELLARAQRAGAVRSDLTLVDVPLIQLMVSATAEMTREVAPELYRRMLQIVLDGLSTSRSGPTPLPADPIDYDDLVAAIARGGCV